MRRWVGSILLVASLQLPGTALANQCVPGSYEKTNNGWSFARKSVAGADLASFRVLPGTKPFYPCVSDSGYAVDRFHAYEGADVLPGADPATFSFLPFGYSHDATHVYYRKVLLSGANARTFTYIGEDFFKDSTHVYLNGAVIKDADPGTFLPLDKTIYPTAGLARDATHVFFQAIEVSNADPKDTKDFGNWYWMSKGRVFFKDRPLLEADAATFKVAEKPERAFSAEDRTHYFLDSKALNKTECRTVGPVVMACRNYVLASGRKYTHLDPVSLHYLGVFPRKCWMVEGWLIFQDDKGLYVFDGDGLLGKVVGYKGHEQFRTLDKAVEDRLCHLGGTGWVMTIQ